MSILPDDKTERGGWWIFSLPAEHPFKCAFQAHDRIFGSRDKGFPGMTRAQADRFLLRSMLTIAKERKSAKLKAEAYLYYGLARTFGGLFW